MKISKITTKIILILLLGCLISACGSNAASDTSESQNNASPNGKKPQNQPSSQQSDSSDPDEDKETSIEDIHAAWQASSHANTFLVDSEGQNNTCAQCHAPINWKPSMDTIPESCFSCKFELEDPPPYIPEDNWENIPCKVCHELNKRGEVEPEIKWLEIAAIDEYKSVESSTELCQKCHLADEPLEGHNWVSVQGPHQDEICTSCHDPHATEVECVSCHTDLDFTTGASVGHDQDHLDISCLACHDNSGLAVEIDAETNTWQVFMETLDGTNVVGSSHNIVLEVTCTRCHFSDNPWGLSTQP